MTELGGKNLKPASACIWYVLATVAGEPRSTQDLGRLMRDNAYFWNGLMAPRIATFGGWSESKLGHDLGLKELTKEAKAEIRKALDTRGFKGVSIPHVNAPIDFSNVVFAQHTSFTGYVFGGEVRLDNTVFPGVALFNEAKFAGNSTFDGATFIDALFMSAEFAGAASFHNVDFLKRVYFSHAQFLAKTTFAHTTFSDEAFFNSAKFAYDAGFVDTVFTHRVDFQSAEFKGPTRFQKARFETRVPAFFDATFHEYTDWQDARWPDVTGDANEAREQIQHYQRLALVMNKLEKPDDRHLFFRLEMRARLRADGWSLAGVGNWLYQRTCDYGYGLRRISFLWFGHLVLGAILICATRAFGPKRKGISWQTVYEFMCDLPQAIVISFSNAHGFFGLNRGFLQDSIKYWAGVPFFNLIGVGQTVVGAVILFFLLLTIRNRFRMR